jgi:hypothetical protein
MSKKVMIPPQSNLDSLTLSVQEAQSQAQLEVQANLIKKAWIDVTSYQESGAWAWEV